MGDRIGNSVSYRNIFATASNYDFCTSHFMF